MVKTPQLCSEELMYNLKRLNIIKRLDNVTLRVLRKDSDYNKNDCTCRLVKMRKVSMYLIGEVGILYQD
jgi:hypothetical protein